MQCLQNDASGSQIGHHDFTEAIVRVDGFVQEQRKRGRRWEEARREIPHHHVGGCGGQIDQTALGEEKRWKRGIHIPEIWTLRATVHTHLEIAEVNGVNVEGGRVERGIVVGEQERRRDTAGQV